MIGYHANDRNRCDRFINSHEYLIIDSKDTNFLGKGMYFWEHQSRAEWWLREKHKESIVCAELNLERMLDLTDDEKLKYIGNIANKFDFVMRKKGIKQGQIGSVLNYIFENVSFLAENYTSIRGHFSYENKKEPDFLYGSKLTGKCVDIYLIRSNPDLVTKRLWVKI